MKIVVSIWCLVIAFAFGFACSRIHDSERVARMWSEARKARDQYHQLLMSLEKSDPSCKQEGKLIQCDGGVWFFADWEARYGFSKE